MRVLFNLLKNDFFNKIGLKIKGASSGIGRATAILFSQLGSKLVLVGRDEKALDETIQSCVTESKDDVFQNDNSNHYNIKKKTTTTIIFNCFLY